MKVAIVSADTMIYRKQKDDTCSPIVRRVLDQVSFKTELVQPVPNDREVIRKILAKTGDWRVDASFYDTDQKKGNADERNSRYPGEIPDRQSSGKSEDH